jgi:hypothetical protein
MNILLDGIEVLMHFRREIAEYTRKIRHRIKFGREQIIVLGSAGVGKTTLGQILADDNAYLGDEYKDSLNIEQFSYHGRVFGSVLVGPGQHRRRLEHWPSLRRQISKGRASGIIFVVAAGYNALRKIEIEDHEMFEQGMTTERFMRKYLAANIANDVEIIRDELAPWISDAPGRIWFITAILKKDLWASREKSIIRQYDNGPFGRVLDEIARNRGTKGFVRETLSASLLIENFSSPKGKLLCKTVSGFDDAQQWESVRNLTRAVSQMMIDKETQET